MDLCRRKTGIRQLILTGELESNSPVNSIPYIGTILKVQFASQNITTVSSLIADLRNTYDQPNNRRNKIRAVKRRLEELTVNPRANRCVNVASVARRSRRLAARRRRRGGGLSRELSAGSTVRPYHVADINVCAYNSLVHILRGLRDPNIREKLHITQMDWGWVSSLRYRQRGTLQGARYCSCLTTESACRNQSDVCSWTREQVCIPKTNRLSARYGFVGRGDDNAQCDHRGTTNETYYKGWRIPDS